MSKLHQRLFTHGPPNLSNPLLEIFPPLLPNIGIFPPLLLYFLKPPPQPSYLQNPKIKVKIYIYIYIYIKNLNNEISNNIAFKKHSAKKRKRKKGGYGTFI